MPTVRYALVLMLGAGCAGRAAETPPATRPGSTAADRALDCARSTAQRAGLHVRLRDPRDPWTLIADGGPGQQTQDVVVVRIIPSVDPDEAPMLSAVATASRGGAGRATDMKDAALRIETRCGRTP